MALLPKLKALFTVWIKDGIQYRVNGLIWILTDAITVFTMPLVWLSSMKGDMVGQLSRGGIVQYYLAMLAVGSFVICHFMWELAYEIKEGIFSAQLVRPISVYQSYFVRNFAWRIVRISLAVPFFLIYMYFYRDLLSATNFHFSWQFAVAMFGGHVLSFTTVMMLGFIALFVEEAYALFELYYFPMLFLSGQIFPVQLLPPWAQTLAQYLPFYYTTNLPVDIVIGHIKPENAYMPLLIQFMFIAITYGISKILWVKGLKQFSGVGM